MKINAAFDGAKSEMANLKDHVHEINEALATGRLVSSDKIDGLDEAVRRYREQIFALEAVGAELSIPIGEDINEIDRAIKQYEQKLKDQCIRDHVLDYFRLTAETADVKQALEDSKRRLAEKCTFGGAELSSTIEACRALLAHIRSDDRRLSDEQYDLIEEHIGKAIARAADRNDLSIDEYFDISIYLDDSCAILATERQKDNEAKDGMSSASTEGEAREDGLNVELVESNTDAEPLNPEQDALLPGYRGIVKEINVNISYNPPAASHKANEYRNLCKQNPEVPTTIFWLGHEKLWGNSQQMSNSVKYYCANRLLIDLLRKTGYFAYLTLKSNLLSKRYFTLSEKGWACYRKQEMIKTQSSGSLMVPAFLRSPASTWNNQTTLSFALIHEFFEKYQRNYQAFSLPQNGFVCGDLIADKSMRVCASIFVDESEQAALSAAKDQIEELQDTDILVLIVFAQEDIRILADALDITSPNVLFSVVEKDYKLMTTQGVERGWDTLF